MQIRPQVSYVSVGNDNGWEKFEVGANQRTNRQEKYHAHFRDFFGWRVFADASDLPGKNKSKSSSKLCISKGILSYAKPKNTTQTKRKTLQTD